MSNVKIEIDESNIAKVSYMRGHIIYNKSIVVDELMNSFASQSGIRVPSLLPTGCRYYLQKGQMHHIFIEIPPNARYIKYVNRDHKVIFEGTVPMPWALLHISASSPEGGVYAFQGGAIYAMKKNLTSESDQLYCFPAANVYSDGNVCWGSTFSSGVTFKTLSDFSKCVDYFFSSEFNTDISPHIHVYSRYEDLLRAIKGKPEFPLDVLYSSSMSFIDKISHI